MRTKAALIACILALAAIVVSMSFAAEKTNFSGTWVLDKDRSFNNPRGFDQTLTIVQNGDEVKVTGKSISNGRETPVDETWIMDGKEREFVPAGAPQGATGKRKASWLPGNRMILVEDETPVTTPNGPAIQRVGRRYSLSADGLTMPVDLFIDSPRGSFEGKRIFGKKVS